MYLIKNISHSRILIATINKFLQPGETVEVSDQTARGDEIRNFLYFKMLSAEIVSNKSIKKSEDIEIKKGKRK